MLYELYVKNLALIDEIRVSFDKGFHALTGETGAGKSILLGSVNLALGAKYSSDLIRQGAEYGYVELTFLVEKDRQKKTLEALDVFPEDGMVVLSRKLMDKRSICKINGETVTVSQMKAVASTLIDIHGQHEHQSLLYKKNHLTILDDFSSEEAGKIRAQVSETYHTYKKLKEEYEEATKDDRERAKEISFLEFEVKEIDEANLQPGEDDILEEQYRRMVNGKKIAENLAEGYEYTGQRGASDALSRAIRCLQEAASYDEKAQELSEQLSEVDSLLNDFNRELAEYSKSLDFSEEEFYEVETRLNEINRLKSKYGNSVEEILVYQQAQEEELARLQNYDEYLSELSDRLEATEDTLKQLCSTLTELRRRAAIELEQAIITQLQDLNFLDVRFEIAFKRTESYTALGWDEVEFMISMNPGEPVRSLGDVASGGELSRIMLAIKTVMASKDEIETLIFDEIDVGISGRTAQKVSEKMARIGKSRQVICITHLAQIAAMADVHYAIEKKSQDGITRTSIRRLSKEEEIEELARILGGAEITDTVMKSAAEMKELAMQTK